MSSDQFASDRIAKPHSERLGSSSAARDEEQVRSDESSSGWPVFSESHEALSRSHEEARDDEGTRGEGDSCTDLASPLPALVCDGPEQEELEDEWRSLEVSRIPLERRIFVSRNLRLDQVELVGFDMDYTLAIYHRERIEELAFHKTLERLVEHKGYPPEIRELSYDSDFVIRGLVIDKQRGNILKANRHGHVRRGYHGRSALSREERHQAYRRDRPGLSGSDFAWVDTLFALPEACLYASIIDQQEAEGVELNYAQLYDDIRESIDEVHRDGSLKSVLMQDLGHYVMKDPELGPSLRRLRSSGKRLFLATNSFWEFTDALMGFLLDEKLPEHPDWRSYFDVVIVGAQKPGFFRDRAPFLELDTEGRVLTTANRLERSGIYQGGNVVDLEKMTGVSGDQILYVGDHIYGDILRSKKSSQWRTCLVVQELEDEILHTKRHRSTLDRLKELSQEASRLDVLSNQYKHSLNSLNRRLTLPGSSRASHTSSASEREVLRLQSALESHRRALHQVIEEMKKLELAFEEASNPYWGPIFKEGNENSLFGEQVRNYACIYTSRVSNLLFYSPLQYFRANRDLMPHESAVTSFESEEGDLATGS